MTARRMVPMVVALVLGGWAVLLDGPAWLVFTAALCGGLGMALLMGPKR